jgi:hypothetical protein
MGFNKLTIPAILFFILIVITSCDDTADCGYEANRKVKLAFATQNKDKKTYADTTVSKLTIYKSNNKSLYDSASASQVGLPLSQLSDSSEFIFKFDSIAQDTLIFISERKLEMISSNCGFNTRFSIDTVIYTKHNISEITIVEKNIDKDLDMGRNCKVILKKRTDIKIVKSNK